MDSHLIRFQKKKFLFLDFETFNLALHDSLNLPWQVATILMETKDNNNGKIINEETSRHDLYLKWDTDLKIGKEAKRITGYSETKFKQKCIPEEEGFEIIYNQVEECDYLVGHNVLGFDIYLLRNWYKKHNKPHSHLPYKVIDTLAIARSVAIDYPYKSQESTILDFQMKMLSVRKRGLKTGLGALGKSNGIEHNYAKLHDALVDLELNVKVWDKLKYQIDF
jgi:DNA polymerase III epsilon subunit-like protein